jgi:hypothetical protein
MALTKSLHTVTAVANVARELDFSMAVRYDEPELLARRALLVLGYTMSDYASDDPTIVKIVRECRIIIGMRARVAA